MTFAKLFSDSCFTRCFTTFAAVFFILIVLFPASPAGAQTISIKDDKESDIAFEVYQTESGDTLRKISANPRIYGDPLKWPLIYFFNQIGLRQFRTTPTGFANYPLPSNTLLAILLPDDAKIRIKTTHPLPPNTWVINLYSAQDESEADALVIRLLDEKFFTYLTEKTIKGKKWVRVRVGFYSDKVAAENWGQKLIRQFKLDDFWVTRISDSEAAEFSGYFR